MQVFGTISFSRSNIGQVPVIVRLHYFDTDCFGLRGVPGLCGKEIDGI